MHPCGVTEGSLKPTLAIIAGPNGSGKSTFYELFLRDAFPLFINADRIAEKLLTIPEEQRNLEAARHAENERAILLSKAATFAFETVFSRAEHWLRFIERAKALNYEIKLFFLCTESPALNVARIAIRAESGGHFVPTDKVINRYARSIETAVKAQSLVDELWIYDNSHLDRTPRLLGLFVRGQVEYIADQPSGWALPFFRR
jgi:predicted ABC-type ATPase